MYRGCQARPEKRMSGRDHSSFMALRMTVQVLLILQALLRDLSRELYGLELAEETGLLPRTAYRSCSGSRTRAG